MGRGKVQLKRIEDTSSRQVTFSKRKGGLFKKAHELAVLCDVEVALIIFSDRGRLYEFCSAESIRKILDRYIKRAEEEEAVCKRSEKGKSNDAEYAGVQTSVNPLQIMKSYLEAQNIEEKDIIELTQLEKELDVILRQTRFLKEQKLREEMAGMEEMAARVREKPSDHGDHALGVLDPNANDMGYSPLREETTLRLSS